MMTMENVPNFVSREKVNRILCQECWIIIRTRGHGPIVLGIL